MLIIEVDRCNGCGACVQACPQGAISLVAGIARIDSSLCSDCQACVDACPTGAIRVAMPIAEREPGLPGPAEATVATFGKRAPVTAVRTGTVATLAAATLGFVGRYLLPRAAEALISALERRPRRASGMTRSGQPSSPPPGTTTATSSGAGRRRGRRRRHRGG